MTMFSGAITALITPFDDNDNLDVLAVKQIVKWQVDNGISGIVISGTTGESPSLVEDEFIELIRNTKKITKDKIPLIVGAGSNNTEKAIYQVRLAEENGADAVMVVVPYYNKPTQEGMFWHFKKISEATDLPIILYNIPGRVVVNMEIETVSRLAELSNIVGIKESTSNINRFNELAAIAKNFDVLSGDDTLTLPARVLGAKGVISVISNILPDVVQKLNKLCDQGKYKEALEIHNKIYKLTNLMFCETNPIPVKYAMSLLGLCKNNLRLPMTPLSQKYELLIQEELRNFYDF